MIYFIVMAGRILLHITCILVSLRPAINYIADQTCGHFITYLVLLKVAGLAKLHGPHHPPPTMFAPISMATPLVWGLHMSLHEHNITTAHMTHDKTSDGDGDGGDDDDVDDHDHVWVCVGGGG